MSYNNALGIREQAASIRLPIFPIRIDWDGSKWTKKPLTQRGHLDASLDANTFNWANANGFGIRMGGGLYALDLDGYKEGCEADQWLSERNINRATRTHQTISGGLHLIYRTHPDWDNLGTRQNIVKGLDSRGSTGWIAYGEGYSVINATAPVMLPYEVCKELAFTGGGTGPSRDVTLKPLEPVDPSSIVSRITSHFHHGRGSFRHRWKGGTHGLTDTSASAMDRSMAQLMANVGFNYSEIYWSLTNYFLFGVVHRDGLTSKTDRDIKRCAAKATKHQDAVRAQFMEKYLGS